MSKFEMKLLNELCEINIGKTPARANAEYWNGKHQWLAISDLKSKYISNTKEGITEKAIKECNMKLIPKDTVVMSFKLSLGKSAILKEQMYSNEAIASFPIKNSTELIPEYLYYALKTVNLEKYADKAAKGVTLNKRKLNLIEIPYTDIESQKQIVRVLEKAEELIEDRQSQIEALDELTQSVFLEMFGDPVANSKGWETVSCKEITTKIGSGATPKGGNSSYKESGISLIRSLNVYNNHFIYKDLAFIDDEQAEKLNNVEVYTNDILLNITGASVARSCIVPDDILPARVNQHVSIIRVKEEMINYTFLSHLFTNEIYQKYLWQIATSGGATREAITKQQLEKLPIILPPLDIQNDFAGKIKKILVQKRIMQSSKIELENMYNSLLQKAFKGELFQV